MTNDEAEKLAIELKDSCHFHAPDQACAIRHLCDHILSGDYKREAQREALELVNRQACDDGLWFVAETVAEAYLQQELRKLHAAVEREALIPAAPAKEG